METRYLHHPYPAEGIYPHDLVLALGFFDGVHLGHQEVIKEAKLAAQARGLPLAVMTFDQHPKIIHSKIAPESVHYLSPLPRKEELMADLGVDILYVVDYSYDFGSQQPQAFVDTYIVGLHAKVVVAGFDYTYGPKPLANMTTLVDHARGRFDIVEVSALIMHRHKVGTSTIKELIEAGEIEPANQELGYIYQTSGQVIHGDKRGRTIGYPTANIQTPSQEVLPAIGVYGVELWVDGQWYPGMASIGYNITFDGIRDLRCEVHIFDFQADIYHRAVKIRWHTYLRNEVKFDSVASLIDQLAHDEIKSRAYLQRISH